MAISIAQIETLINESITAMDAGDYATAIVKATAAQARLGLVPDAERSEASGGSFNFDRRTIGEYLDNLRNLQRENGTVTMSPIEITYENDHCTPGCNDDYA